MANGPEIGPASAMKNYISILGDSLANDDIKLKASQELSEHFETIVQSSTYPTILESLIKVSLKLLEESPPQFIQESALQNVRKLILEMIHRLPICENLRQHVKPIISVMLNLLKIENEDNVLVCLRIIIELHKNFRPSFSSEVQQFLIYVKNIYVDLPKHVTKIFKPIQPLRVKELNDINFDALLYDTYTTRILFLEKLTDNGTYSQTFNLLPKGILSLRVLQELPIIVVLLYQIYKNAVHQEVAEFVPLIMTTINLQLPENKESSYSKEVCVDFMGAQIKTLSFLAYIVRIFQDSVMLHSTSVVHGVLSLMQSCPKEAAHLRKELLIAARHIFATDLRQKFIPCIERLFDEDLLIGKGVTLDAIRPLAYSTLADLTHHVRQSLNLDVLEIASNLFSKNVHDDSLAIGIQTMSCKLLLNLVDCIRQHSESNPTKARSILITLLKVFTAKFRTIGSNHLTQIMMKWKSYVVSHSNGVVPSSVQMANLTDSKEPSLMEGTAADYFQKLSGYGSTSSLNISEYRSLVKTLVGGVKTITWGCISSKHASDDSTIHHVKIFEPEELLIYIELVNCSLEVLDIYSIAVPSGNIFGIPTQRSTTHIPRTKEEKEVLEHFSGIFLMMHPQNFQEVFESTIERMVNRIYKNASLQIIANSFLANPATSPLFATVLIEYLLERMEEMGSNIDRSNLYLRLFKLVFGSVSLFPVENEQMLRPHLHTIVSKSMELALYSEEPYNYFLLLRALFRSIGGGSHDLLYQEFLPLLPNLLEGLNRLQSGCHKQHIKDLFVELCLTVPVRLSSLLPYLPMLMDPLVSALNGSTTLISQGLRTLELCVDNLQPDFLYDHIQPVRASLMQALWKTLRKQDGSALVAFRILGKFGGGNRKMMGEPQSIKFSKENSEPPSLLTYFQDIGDAVKFPVTRIIQSAFGLLNSHNTDAYNRSQCWQIIKMFLAASIKLDEGNKELYSFFMHSSFVEGSISNVSSFQFIINNSIARITNQTALTSLLVASATKELRESVFPFLVGIVRHYTMVNIAQQAGPFNLNFNNISLGIDPLVIVDTLAYCMGHEEKELCKPSHLCIALILETSTHLMGSKDRACRLPIMQYIAEKMIALCYERSWYSKMGGCKAINWLYQNMSLRWIYQHMFSFLKAFMFVIMDLTEDVSNGTIEIAKKYLKLMLETCMVPINNDDNIDLISIQKKTMYEVLHELVRQVTSPNNLVRKEAMSSLKLIATLQNKTVSEIMDPHRDVLVDIIPPKKHLLRHQPASAQIGLMDGNTFCTTLEPRLFTINLNNSYHKLFFHELLTLSEADDSTLMKLDCYKNVSNLVPLRKSALNALAACNYISDNLYKDKIVNIMFKVMENTNVELQEAAFESMRTFVSGYHIEKEKVHAGMRPLLLTLGDHRNLTLSATKRLSFFTQLFPQMFNDKLSEQILQHCQKMLDISISSSKSAKQGGNFLTIARTGEYEKRIVTLIGMFHQITAASSKYIDSLCQLVLQTERTLSIEASSPYREPLMKFLLRYPKETINLFFTEKNISNSQWNRLFIYLLKHKDGEPFRTVISSSKSNCLIKFIKSTTSSSQLSLSQQYIFQHQCVLVIFSIMEFDDQWIATQNEIVAALKNFWISDLYKTCKTNVICDLWHIVGKILLSYFSHNTNEIELLFHLLNGICFHFIPDFQFLRDFLQNTVAQSYTVYWKRNAFFHFVENFHNSTFSDELKAKIITFILIPSFTVSFEKGEGNKLIGAPPAPYQEDENNIVSVFISKLIDPDKPFANEDIVRIALLQLACVLVEKASPHIHDGDANNKRQGNKLRRLMTFAWPCLLNKNCVDPSSRYHGHLLLAHIIARLAIHKKIVLQVFHSLLKGHALEARPVVRLALDVLTPAMPLRMEDGNTMLTHWTKKILVEEGHAIQQLFHILQLIVRHFKVYYPVRHYLVTYMTNYMQRLGFPPNASVEHKKLAVELAEVIIKWELQRIKEHESCDKGLDCGAKSSGIFQKQPSLKKSCTSDNGEKKYEELSDNFSDSSLHSQPLKTDGIHRPIEKVHCDNVLNFLVRLACQVNDAQSIPGIISPGEGLSRRCVLLMKMAMRTDVWHQPFDLKLNWLDKVFLSLESSQGNIGNICTGLDILTYLITNLEKDFVLSIIRPIQRGLSACIISQNTRIIRLMHSFLMRLMALFPSDIHQKHEDLEIVYTAINKMISDNLTNYEKLSQPSSTSLFGTLMTLKACCSNNISFIDRIMFQFMRVLNRLTKDHLSFHSGNNLVGTQLEGTNLTIELLILSIELVKNRISVMGVEIRKLFIGNILSSLIEKSSESKILKCIVKLVDDWIRTKSQNSPLVNIPSLREKSILLIKLMQYIEKKFSDDLELNAQFLELICFIYSDEYLNQTELTAKLEGAYLAGLRCQQPNIRGKFFEILDISMRRRLHDRILYIICSQAWDNIGVHFWIKQCIELLLLTVNNGSTIKIARDEHMIPNITSGFKTNEGDKERNYFSNTVCVDKSETETIECNDDIINIQLFNDLIWNQHQHNKDLPNNRYLILKKIINRQSDFTESNRKWYTEKFLASTSQLCHFDTDLAETVWLEMFPRFWSLFSDIQQKAIEREIVPFLSSGTHIVQKDSYPSAINTFIEGLVHCKPAIYLPPKLVSYLGKSHNLWHRTALLLEDMSLNFSKIVEKYQILSDVCVHNSDVYSVNTFQINDSLSLMYSSMHEEDLWAGLWMKIAKYSETNTAIAYEQMGYFDDAQGTYDLAMTKLKFDVVSFSSAFEKNSEVLQWQNHWIRCAIELNQWDSLLDYALASKEKNNFLVVDCAWRVPNWTLMKQALINAEQSFPKKMGYKVNLYKGYLAMLNPEDQQLSYVEKYVEISSGLCMREWRRLPYIISHLHLRYLQAAQQIMELQEAYQIHQGLVQCRNSSLHDMKAIVKTWRNRLPVISDDLSHWNDIFTWRQHHYQIITQNLEQQSDQTNVMLGVHASAQAIIHFGKIARKHNLTGVCQETLSRIYTIPSVPIVDCFQKIRQQVKCYLQMASISDRSELNEALEVIESTNLKYFTSEMNGEFYALKGLLLSQIGRSEEAGKAFSASVQLHDGLNKAWGLWGDYLENIFSSEKQLIIGVSAIICFLHACRHQNERKSRKYLAKILWLLTYDDSSGSLLSAIEKYVIGVPPLHWLPWVPQLLCCLVQYDGNVILNLLSHVGRIYPQAIYFPIRTLYLTLKIEQREKHKSTEHAHFINKINSQAMESCHDKIPSHEKITCPTFISNSTQMQNPQQYGSQSLGSSTVNPIKATPSMWRCSKVMHVQREIHPTVLSSLEGIVDQMVWFRESWTEEVLRQLRQGLIKCYAIAFENRRAVNNATITPHTLHFLKKLGSTFGIGIENIQGSVASSSNSAASESLARRAQVTFQDPVFQKMKEQFTSDFDFSQPGAMKLHNLINKLKAWIEDLETKVKKLPSSFLIEDKCRFLSNFSQKTAEVELPGEFLIPPSSHYHIRIARFMPRVEIVQKNYTAARRLYIRGTNGQIYPYLVIIDSGLGDARREERVLQLMRMLNYYLGKQKETTKRFLHLTVPKVVPISPQMRLADDNPASISLREIYKNECAKLNVDHENYIVKYYEHLSDVQKRGAQTSHSILRDIFRDIQDEMVPTSLMKTWTLQKFKFPTDYWQFRKMFTIQLALSLLSEHVFYLTRLNADMMYIHQDSGLINVSYFKFDISDDNGELCSKRPVPFRLTPNICEFISSIGIAGPLSASFVAATRCFAVPSYKLNSILQAIVCDEIICFYKRRTKEDKINNDIIVGDNHERMLAQSHIGGVNNAVTYIMKRINNFTHLENIESNKISILISTATNPDNLCRMDPAWHPWL